MQEVQSLPTVPAKLWPVLLLSLILFCCMLAAVVTRDVYYLCVGISCFAGWLIMLDVNSSKLRIMLLATIVGSLTSGLTDAMAFGLALSERGVHHIVWSKVLQYCAAAFLGSTISLFRK